MSDRERWIVYPLLFLAIGLAFRTNLVLDAALHETQTVDVDTVRCKLLEVVGADGKPRILLHTSSNGDGIAEASNAEGKLQAQLSLNANGTMLRLLDQAGQSMLQLGYEEHLAVLLVTNPAASQIHPLFAVPILPVSLSESKPAHSGREPPAEPEKKTDETKPPQK